MEQLCPQTLFFTYYPYCYNTVEYYASNGSTVNSVCLDLSKAFDKVNLYGLAIKLMNRNVPKSFVSVIIDWYNKICVKVRWNETLSSSRTLRSGVRQGGILSPSLFNIYVNDILTQLQASKTGCFVANRYVGALMYADDLLLVSITITDIRAMIALVCQELKWLDMKINVKKSSMIRVGPRFNVPIEGIELYGAVLPLCETITYLGVEICAGRKFRLSIYLRRIKFFRAFNAIYAKLSSSTSEVVTLNMIQSFCVPILCYGLECVFMSKSLAASLAFCWSRVMYKIFNISESTCSESIMFYMGHLPMSYQLDLCKLRFYHNIYHNFLSGDKIVWHVAHAVKRRLIDQLFCTYCVYIRGSVASYSRAVWSELSARVLAK